MKQYRCIEGFAIDNYDENGFLIENSQSVIEEGTIYELDESGRTMISGEVHLDGADGSWLEIPKDALNEYFKEVDLLKLQ